MNSTKYFTSQSLLATQAVSQRVSSVGSQLCPPLTGVEVRDSSFGEWLAAGGERRARPREATTADDLAKRGRAAEAPSALDRLHPSLMRR